MDVGLGRSGAVVFEVLQDGGVPGEAQKHLGTHKFGLKRTQTSSETRKAIQNLKVKALVICSFCLSLKRTHEHIFACQQGMRGLTLFLFAADGQRCFLLSSNKAAHLDPGI